MQTSNISWMSSIYILGIFICMVGTNQGFSGYSRQKSLDSPIG